MRRLLWVVSASLVVACGDRTALLGAVADAVADTGASDVRLPPDAAVDAKAEAMPPVDATLDAPMSCSPPSLVEPLRVHVDLPFSGAFASSGCSFAATWVENGATTDPVKAVTFRFIAGAWGASKVTTVVEANQNSVAPSFVAWDGSAYVVAWTDNGLHFARIGEDATLLGPVVDSFTKIGPDAVIAGLAIGSDRELRLGLLDDPGTPFQYRAYFARVLADGTTLQAPVAVTPPGQFVNDISFLLAAGGSEALWVNDVVPESLTLTTFADDGTVGATRPLFMGRGIQESLQGLARGIVDGSATDYAGTRTAGSTDVALEELTEGGAGSTPIAGIAGGFSPALAAVGNGTLGVLTPIKKFGTGFRLAIVQGTTVVSSMTVATNVTANSYFIAGATTTFGMLFEGESDLFFAAVTP